MSSGNGESQARITDYIEGTVGATNARGLHLNGEEAWRNWKRRLWHGPARRAALGQRAVRLLRLGE